MTKQPIPPQVEYAVEQLKWLRVMLKLNISDLKMEGTKSFWSDFENLRGEPRISTIIRYCDAIGISLDNLLRGCPTSSGVSRMPDDKTVAKLARRYFGLTKKEIDFLLNADRRWEVRDSIWVAARYVQERVDKWESFSKWFKWSVGCIASSTIHDD